jgi:hypothetical protein
LGCAAKKKRRPNRGRRWRTEAGLLIDAAGAAQSALDHALDIHHSATAIVVEVGIAARSDGERLVHRRLHVGDIHSAIMGQIAI